MANRAKWRWFRAWIYTGLVMALMVLLFIPRLRIVAGVIWVIVAVPIFVAKWLYLLEDVTPSTDRSRSDESAK